MSMPNIPDINSNVNINRDDAVNIILSSIGMEELSLAHILNAEAEKIQFALGTLETSGGTASSLDDIMKVNNSAKKMLRDVIKNQMLIGMKMEDTVELAQMSITEEVKVEAIKEEATKEEAVEAEPIQAEATEETATEEATEA